MDLGLRLVGTLCVLALALLYPGFARAAECLVSQSDDLSSLTPGVSEQTDEPTFEELAGPGDELVSNVLELSEAACAQAQAESSELVDCGAQWQPSPDEPALVSLLRVTHLELAEERCTDLLTETWRREACAIESRDCGNYMPGAAPVPAPKLLPSGASGRVSPTDLDAVGASRRRLALPGEIAVPKSCDLSPPVPPPRILPR